MEYNRELELLASASRLYLTGIEVEKARDRLKELVAAGVPYDSDEMANAVKAFQWLNDGWKQLEEQHIALRDSIQTKPQRSIASSRMLS